MAISLDIKSMEVTGLKEADAIMGGSADSVPMELRPGFLRLHLRTREIISIRFETWIAAERIAAAINVELGVTA